jgi:hypothetical protein
MKRFSSRLKKRAHADYKTVRRTVGQRNPFASQWAQQQNTRPR